MQTMLQQLQVTLQTMVDFRQFPWQWQVLSCCLDAVLQLQTRSTKSFGCTPSLNFLAGSPWSDSPKFWNLLQDIWMRSQERPCFSFNLFSITWIGSAQDSANLTQKNAERRHCACGAHFSFRVAFVVAAWPSSASSKVGQTSGLRPAFSSASACFGHNGLIGLFSFSFVAVVSFARRQIAPWGMALKVPGVCSLPWLKHFSA